MERQREQALKAYDGETEEVPKEVEEEWLHKVRVKVEVRVMSQLISTTQHITHKVVCRWVTSWEHEPITLPQ